MTGRNARYFSKPPGGVWGGTGPLSTRFFSCTGRIAHEISKAQVWLGASPVSTGMLTLGCTYRIRPSFNQILVMYRTECSRNFKSASLVGAQPSINPNAHICCHAQDECLRYLIIGKCPNEQHLPHHYAPLSGMQFPRCFTRVFGSDVDFVP